MKIQDIAEAEGADGGRDSSYQVLTTLSPLRVCEGDRGSKVPRGQAVNAGSNMIRVQGHEGLSSQC